MLLRLLLRAALGAAAARGAAAASSSNSSSSSSSTSSSSSAPRPALAGAAAPVGPVFTVWDTRNSSCEKKFGPIDLPDTPARAFLDAGGATVLVTVDSTSRLSFGPSLLNTTRDCTIVLNSTLSPDPSRYATDDGFIDATHSFGNGTVVALLHDEFPGMNFNNCDVKPVVWPCCWSVSLSLAISNDWGHTWARASEPPSNLVAAVPYRYDPAPPAANTIFGWGDSGGITPHPTDGFFYVAMNNRMTKELQSNGTCVMRTNALLDPRSWRGWSGSDFSVPFVSAYTLAPGEEAAHICTVLEPFAASPCTVLGTTYSTYLGAFVATLGCWADAQPVPFSNTFLWTTSPDFAHWAVPVPLFTPPSMPSTQFYLYPALLDANAPARGDNNFMTIGETATLTFVAVRNNFYTEGRQLLGQNFTFSR